MGPAIDVPDALTRHVGVKLGRADTRMSEQFLNDAQVGATLEQVRRERVAQGVRAHARPEAGARRGALDDGPCLLPGEPPSARLKQIW